MKITLELPSNELGQIEIGKIFLRIGEKFLSEDEIQELQDGSFLVKTEFGNVYLNEPEID